MPDLVRTCRAAHPGARFQLTQVRDELQLHVAGDLNDLDAILDRHSEEETADIRRILTARRAA